MTRMIRPAALLSLAVLGILVGGASAHAQRPYFGIGLVENHRRGGLQIVEIVRGGPVDEANRAELAATGKVLLDSLDVIFAVNGDAVRTHTDMVNAINRITPGDQVRMDCEDRFGTPFHVFVTPQAGGVIHYRAGSGHPSGGKGRNGQGGGRNDSGRPGGGRPGSGRPGRP